MSLIRSLALYTQQYIQVILPASSQPNVYDIYLLLCIQYWTPNDGQKTSPRHVEFYSKNKFEKLVHLVGFIIKKLSQSRFGNSFLMCRRQERDS
jgi:hypothetical protein